MFNLFGKKPVMERPAAELANKIENDNLDNEIIVHVMPKQFRTAHADASNAKSTGILILLGGAIFLLAIGVGIYYFIFVYQPAPKTPVAVNTVATNSPAVLNEPAKEVLEASSTPIEIVATSTATSTPEQLASSTSQINLTPAVDTDQDGLTDQEEALIGTDSNKQDTDNDGYNDLAELIKLFNPTGAGTIENALNIKKYSNKDFAYSFLYPSVWNTTVLANDTIKIGPVVDLNSAPAVNNPGLSADSQFIQVNVSVNQKKQTIADWYKEQFSQSSIDTNNIITHQNASGQTDWQGIKNQDGLTVYLTDKSQSHIFTINYDLSLGNTLIFPNIFNLVINSFNIN